MRDGVSTSYIRGRGLVSRIYKELQKLNTNHPVNEWACERNQQFSKDKTEVTNKYLKEHSTPFTIWEIGIKNALCHPSQNGYEQGQDYDSKCC